MVTRSTSRNTLFSHWLGLCTRHNLKFPVTGIPSKITSSPITIAKEKCFLNNKYVQLLENHGISDRNPKEKAVICGKLETIV